MEKHTMYLTQNLIDFLGFLTMGQATVIEKSFSEALMYREGVSREDADEAAEAAFMELHDRVSQFKTKELFTSFK